MTKKINFDDTVKKVEGVSNKVNIIMRNRLIIAIFLIVDGITFILNPNGSLAEMARSIIILVLLASFSTLLANLSIKPRDKKSIIISIIILVIGIILYIYPYLISAYIQLVLSLFLICDGVINIANTLNFNKLSGYSKAITQKYNNLVNDKKNKEKNKNLKEVDKNISEGMEQQKARLLTPLKNVVDKSHNSTKLYIATNIVTIIIGIFLIIFPNVSMVLWGIIFLYTGFSNLLASMKAMNISKKIKEKKFKEIIYDEDNQDEKNK